MLRRGTKTEHGGRAVDAAPARVLVVNDDEGACELVCRILAAAGHTVERAASNDQALGMLNLMRPDCVVLDLATGGIGQNLKLLETIRSHMDVGVANSRVVLIAHQTSNRMFSWQVGIDSFLVRPFHADELVHDVAEVLARPEDDRARHRRRELDAATSQGRTLDVQPWDTKRF
jgi:DNA-binding response OmpR family regulator